MSPKLDELKLRYKDQREELARKTMELFRTYQINPLSSIVLLFIQIPIIFALYFAVYKGGGIALPSINEILLYPFIPIPETVNMIFLGLIDITEKSLPLALLAGITQYIHTNLSLPPMLPREAGAEPNFKEDLKRSMHLQMKYVLPVIIVFAAYSISAAIGLYFTISNIMSIAQEYIVRQKGLKLTDSTT